MTLVYGDALRVQARVVATLVLRDMRTRFGRTLFGYVIIVGWPLTHLLAIMLIYVLVRHFVPIGTDAAIFFGTGVLPYILFLYPARMIMLCLVQNQSLLYFPIVKSLDVILARGILEIMTAFWVTALFGFILYVFGIDIVPLHLDDAIAAILATIYLGFSFGLIGAILYKLMRAWLAFQVGIILLMYFGAGVLFLPTALPEVTRNVLWYNPLLHSVEWLRSAYYDGYGYGMLSTSYLFWFATGLLFIGLLLERAIRGRLLHQ